MPTYRTIYCVVYLLIHVLKVGDKLPFGFNVIHLQYTDYK